MLTLTHLQICVLFFIVLLDNWISVFKVHFSSGHKLASVRLLSQQRKCFLIHSCKTEHIVCLHLIFKHCSARRMLIGCGCK